MCLEQVVITPARKTVQMKFLSWNIQHGGGKRADQIIRQIDSWEPDVVGLSEFRGTKPSQFIAEALASAGLQHQATTTNKRKLDENRLLLASRFPFELQNAAGILNETGRWLQARFNQPITIDVIVMHVPNRNTATSTCFTMLSSRDFWLCKMATL